MFVKVVTLKRRGSNFEHYITEVHEADSLQVIDENAPQKDKFAKRTYTITNKGNTISIETDTGNKDLKHSVFLENVKGDTIGRY